MRRPGVALSALAHMALPQRALPRLPKGQRRRAQQSALPIRHGARALRPRFKSQFPSPSLSNPPRDLSFQTQPPNPHPDPRHQIPHLRHPRHGQRERHPPGRQGVPGAADGEGEEAGGGADPGREEPAGDHAAGEGVERGPHTRWGDGSGWWGRDGGVGGCRIHLHA